MRNVATFRALAKSLIKILQIMKIIIKKESSHVDYKQNYESTNYLCQKS